MTREQGRVGKLSIEKRKIVNEDGRYLIYYTFTEEGEREASPPEATQEDGELSSKDASRRGTPG